MLWKPNFTTFEVEKLGEKQKEQHIRMCKATAIVGDKKSERNYYQVLERDIRIKIKSRNSAISYLLFNLD